MRHRPTYTAERSLSSSPLVDRIKPAVSGSCQQRRSRPPLRGGGQGWGTNERTNERVWISPCSSRPGVLCRPSPSNLFFLPLDIRGRIPNVPFAWSLCTFPAPCSETAGQLEFGGVNRDSYFLILPFPKPLFQVPIRSLGLDSQKCMWVGCGAVAWD